MGVTFKNTPPGKATIVKKVTSGEAVVLDTQEDETVVMPSAAGATISWGDEGVGQTAVLQAEAIKPWAEVGFTAGFTKNMGNFNSARVDITIRLPCQTDEIDEAYEFAESWVTTRLQKQHEDL